MGWVIAEEVIGRRLIGIIKMAYSGDTGFETCVVWFSLPLSLRIPSMPNAQQLACVLALLSYILRMSWRYVFYSSIRKMSLLFGTCLHANLFGFRSGTGFTRCIFTLSNVVISTNATLLLNLETLIMTCPAL